MAGFSKKDEKFRQYALTASPLRVLLSVCMPLALYQALQSIFKILDALMASHIGADAVSAVVLRSDEADLTLFMRDRYALDYVIVRCVLDV